MSNFQVLNNTQFSAVFFWRSLRNKKYVLRGYSFASPPVTYYQRPNCSSDFHAIRYQSFYRKLSSIHEFWENHLVDRRNVLKGVNKFVSAPYIIYWWIFFWMENRKYCRDVYSDHYEFKDKWSHSFCPLAVMACTQSAYHTTLK